MFEIEVQPGMIFGDTTRYLQARKKMIQEQIINRGVKDPKVLKAIEAIPRHRFVNEILEGSAHDDTPVPIGDDQTISQPFIVAYMTAALQLKGDERILEVGTGSGYQAAVLSEIVKEVFTVEINDNLAIEVALRFKKMSFDNITLKFGDGYDGWSEQAPFDGIVVTAAPDHIPQKLVNQLTVSGRLIIPVGDKEQELVVVTKDADGSAKKRSLIPVRFVPMIRNVEKRFNPE